MDKISFECTPAEVGLQQLVFTNDDIDIIVRNCNKQETTTYNINVINTQDSDTHLAPREREVLVLVAAGMTNKEIGVKLDLQIVTVKKYVSALLYKLDVTNRVMLSNYYHNYLASYIG